MGILPPYGSGTSYVVPGNLVVSRSDQILLIAVVIDAVPNISIRWGVHRQLIAKSLTHSGDSVGQFQRHFPSMSRVFMWKVIDRRMERRSLYHTEDRNENIQVFTRAS